MKNNFDLRKFLVENKLTLNSKTLNEDSRPEELKKLTVGEKTYESVNEGIDWDELILKAKPGSAIKIGGKFYIKDKYGNWRHEDDENDILVNRDIAKIANNKNMKVRKSGIYHIIESINEDDL